MKCMKKVLACTLLVATTFMTSGVSKVEAFEDPYAEFYCHETQRELRCVGPMSSTGITIPHLVINSSNVSVYCGVVEIYGRHDLHCVKCHEYVDSLELPHVRYHDICDTENGLCQEYYKNNIEKKENEM
ncbi:MAG: hypothetical protein IJZ55_10970 [Lachnospiraceae bacterium]|nr:hypothetical protein [Lachnospiraceae bacterium]